MQSLLKNVLCNINAEKSKKTVKILYNMLEQTFCLFLKLMSNKLLKTPAIMFIRNPSS